MARVRTCWLQRRMRQLSFCALAVLACACFNSFASAADVATAVADHLQAGEFGPARAVIERIPAGAQRDAQLRRMAAAQSAAGARRASLATASSMADDRMRAGALGDIASQPVGGFPGFGGGTQADFDTLIELITATIAPTTWEEVGGPGAIDGFPGGVYVDGQGVVQRILDTDAAEATGLAHRRDAAAVVGANRDVRRRSPLRKVSLPRLEKQVQLRWAAGGEPTGAMQMLAGLQKIQYVFLYPESGDIVLAGPAGNWRTSGEGRLVSVETGGPVLQLDDFVVLLRCAFREDGRFGCSITPTQQNLAETKAFLAESARQPLKPNQRAGWLAKLRAQLGNQDIDVYGIDARTRAARVIVEADYRMKLVGMGLEDGTLGVESYLDRIQVPPGSAPPPMSVLRWWFTLNYDALHATKPRDAFQLHGQGVKVLSENEMLSEQGKRIHTGKSDELNREFARDFTKHFPALAAKYPIYAELRNIFDLALVAALIRSEDLPSQVDWHMTHIGDAGKYRVELGVAPTKVPTVINHRVIHRKHIVAGVSGGVTVRTAPLVKREAIKVDDYGLLKAGRQSAAAPADLPADRWWWD